MTITFNDMADWENAAHAANKPILLDGMDASLVNKAQTGWFTGYTGAVTNITDTSTISNAQVRAYDRIGALTVSSTNSTVSTPTFTMDFTSTITFDTIVILGHNFGSLATYGSPFLFLTLDDGTSTNILSADTYTITDDNRIVITHLYDRNFAKPTYPKRVTITGTPEIHVRLANRNINTGQPVPSIGELYIGQRSQLMHNPNLPFDDKSETGLVSDFASKSGLTQRYTFNRGRATRTISKSVTDSNELAGIERAFDESDDFTKPIMWIENPAASSPDAYLMLAESPTLSLPLQGPIERVFQTSLTEQPPFKSTES